MHQQLIKAPLVTVDRVDSFDIHAHLDGGGPSGQAGALRLAIARALILVQPEDRPALKKAGFLTRDPRAIERKKYGLKKARKAPQYSQALICLHSPPGVHTARRAVCFSGFPYLGRVPIERRHDC